MTIWISQQMTLGPSWEGQKQILLLIQYMPGPIPDTGYPQRVKQLWSLLPWSLGSTGEVDLKQLKAHCDSSLPWGNGRYANIMESQNQIYLRAGQVLQRMKNRE